jgi:hypothetical protein
MTMKLVSFIAISVLVVGCTKETPITEDGLLGTWKCKLTLDENIDLDITEKYLADNQYLYSGTYILALPNGRRDHVRYQVTYSGTWNVKEGNKLALHYEKGYEMLAVDQENEWARGEVEWIMSHKPAIEVFGATFRDENTLKLVDQEFNDVDYCKRLESTSA